MPTTHPRAPLPVLLLGAALVGCGGPADAPRFDNTSGATRKASMERMVAGMDGEAKRSLASDITSIVITQALRTAIAQGKAGLDQGSGVTDGPQDMKPLHGPSAAEIRAKAEAMRADPAKGGAAIPGK